MNSELLSQEFGFVYTLPNERSLGYFAWGPEKGIPVLLFHGIPGSRYLRFADDALLKKLNIRLISVERPGYGISEPYANRKILDWADDIKSFIDGLSIRTPHIIAFAGGAPFALACAHKLRKIVGRIALVNGAEPFFELIVRQKLSLKGRDLAEAILSDPIHAHERIAQDFESASQLLLNLIDTSSPSDKEFFSKFEIKTLLRKVIEEGVKQSLSGFEYAREFVLLFRDWGFPLSEIKSEVTIWYGEEDWNEYNATTKGEFFSNAITNSSIIKVPSEGSAILWTKAEEILIELLK